MRLRTLGVAVAAVLAMAGLAGCRTNVGTAAVIDGHRITESDVNQYVTPKAQPVPIQNSSGGNAQMPPRSFVVRELIYDRLFRAVLAKTPGGSPTDAQLDAKLRADLAGKDPKQVAERTGLKGFTSDFDRLALRAQELSSALNSAQQTGVDIISIAKKLHFSVSVSPRYGSWNGKTFAFDSGPALPGYLSVQPSGAAG